ncbi:MAG: DUF2062 domain-containing protein [Nitrospirota bacterium]
MSTLGLRDKLQQVVLAKDSPKKIAISFAAGIFIGMSPVLGLHTVLGIVAAWIFGLNKFVTIVGVYITNPWTIIPIYTFSTWVGARLLGITDIIPAVDWNNMSFTSLLGEIKPLLLPFIFGSTLIGAVSAAIGYVVVYQAVMKRRND